MAQWFIEWLVVVNHRSLVQSLLMQLILFVPICLQKKCKSLYSRIPSRVRAESKQSLSEVDNNLCSDCTWTVLGLLRLCLGCLDSAQSPLGIGGGE